MPDRENSPAYAALPRSARRVFAAIERAIGDRSSARVSYTDFMDHHIVRQSISVSLKLLDHLGLIEIAPGPRLVNVFRLSNRWRTIDEVEAVRLAALARELKPHRTFAKPPESMPVKPPKPKPMTVERPPSCSGGCRHCRRCLGRTTGGDRLDFVHRRQASTSSATVGTYMQIASKPVRFAAWASCSSSSMHKASAPIGGSKT